jgi:hypothetical protein
VMLERRHEIVANHLCVARIICSAERKAHFGRRQ